MSVYIERLPLCTCPQLSHVHSPIGTKRQFSAVKISLQQTRCPLSAIAVDGHAHGANFYPWSLLDSPFQHGRYAAV